MSTLPSGLLSRIRPSRLALFDRQFICRRCFHQQPQKQLKRQHFSQSPKSSINRNGSITFGSTFTSKQLSRPQSTFAIGVQGPAFQSANREGISDSSTSSRSSSFPDVSSRSVGYWLLASATSVFGIVVFGGLTRLTESGLSITEWRPVTGSFPPRDAAAWESEFALYKQSPEFKMLNSRMNLDEFKQIYWMEWTHRLWGRMVGLTFLVPTVYFVARKRVARHMAFKLTAICGLIGFQGFIGWWMVKSGLKDDLLETGSHPRVSQYRLATHLGTAFAAYLAMLWNGMQILRENKLVANPEAATATLDALRNPSLKLFRRSVAGLSILTFVTAMSGALVAGLDAGLVYNDFPWMGRPAFFPPKKELLDPFYAHTSDQSDLVWRNMFENPVLAQLDHRIMATSTFCAVMGLWAYSRFNPAVRSALPRNVKRGVSGIVQLVSLQVVLGISTLWYLVPTYLASAHQAGALALLTGMFVLGGRVWVPQRTAMLVKRALARAQSRSNSTMPRPPTPA